MRVLRRIGLLFCLVYFIAGTSFAKTIQQMTVDEIVNAPFPVDHLDRAQKLSTSDQYEQAVAEFTECISRSSAAQKRLNASRAKCESEQALRLRQPFDQSVDDDPFILESSPNRLCQAYYGRAYEYSQLGMHVKAANDYRDGTQVDTSFTSYTESSNAAPYIWQPDYIAANRKRTCYRVAPIILAALVILFATMSAIVAIRARLFVEILLLPLLSFGIYCSEADTCTLLHFGISAISAYSALRFMSLKSTPWVWFYGLIAVFYNPFVRVHLDQATWSAVDFSDVLIVAVSLLMLSRRSRKANLTTLATSKDREVAPPTISDQISAIDHRLNHKH